ncbi:helix-turn-helix domain-containing protein [uncultured Fusobacterium sp.]|uniref:helix-turn-helix domain-containing protein n=1 Tax=uncultured Fusobacterium sp. TaxID=159267 RepID=UPI0025985FC4|nr:helix-turn-helix domain-containing protein [uncultured Fusobacterium sp.]
METTKYKDLENYSDVLSLEDISNYFKISKDTARKLCLTNQLKHIRIGRLYKVTKNDLIEFLETRGR